MTVTHTRVHVYVELANPYLTCDYCDEWVTAWHDNDKCGCDRSAWNMPCEHNAGVTSSCPSWGPGDGCICQQTLGDVSHGEPPAYA